MHLLEPPREVLRLSFARRTDDDGGARVNRGTQECGQYGSDVSALIGHVAMMHRAENSRVAIRHQ